MLPPDLYSGAGFGLGAGAGAGFGRGAGAGAGLGRGEGEGDGELLCANEESASKTPKTSQTAKIRMLLFSLQPLRQHNNALRYLIVRI